MAKRKQTSSPSEKLFADDQIDMFEKSYEEQLKEEKNKPVECLGMTFENDEIRREYFLEKLCEKLKDPEFRKIEGFPFQAVQPRSNSWLRTHKNKDLVL
ncbi:MAG: hypothetical protein H8E19_16355 [Deltaproteobacteria bacterium]|uniref:Uncharacterized protein n=1 Tax=Candidatus Desulfacyla euxinica TaxID=2841693 RepID=A0A8J6N2G9_9DELT|nr:hypothetical protein [Candidatus Desulfacyla euxinica]MBL7217981.1 hypothetical protein [Desulfobacteraceae bacterium]